MKFLADKKFVTIDGVVYDRKSFWSDFDLPNVNWKLLNSFLWDGSELLLVSPKEDDFARQGVLQSYRAQTRTRLEMSLPDLEEIQEYLEANPGMRLEPAEDAQGKLGEIRVKLKDGSEISEDIIETEDDQPFWKFWK